jgi:hypothetical protein
LNEAGCDIFVERTRGYSRIIVFEAAQLRRDPW